MEVSIYIKSRFKGNPRGMGGAAAVAEFIGKSGALHIRKRHIWMEHDTRNALYLKMCITAIQLLIKPCHITIYLDCNYIANAYRLGWVQNWQKDGWKKANGKPLANAEEWKQFYRQTQMHTINFRPYDSRYDVELEEILKESWHRKISCDTGGRQ